MKEEYTLEVEVECTLVVGCTLVEECTLVEGSLEEQCEVSRVLCRTTVQMTESPE